MQPNATSQKDPNESLVYEWDWSAWLLAGVGIASQSFTVTVMSGNEPGGTPSLTTDGASAVAGTPTQKYLVRLNGGTVGVTYRVTHQIVTTESPAQTAQRSIAVVVAKR